MQLNIRTLKAVAVAASVKQTRYYLNGVNVQVADGQAVMIATNGHMMLGARHATDGDACACIIPLALIKSVKLDKKAGDMAEFTFDGKDIAIRYAGSIYGSGAIDGTFPNWRAVVPREPASGDAAQFNPEYIAAFAGAARVAGGKNITIAHNGNNPALVTWHDDNTFGVLMPIRSDDIPTLAPAWARA